MIQLSIITINFNNANGLKKTIESVISQTFKNFEYIIVDGGSNDGSINIIKNYESTLDFWISEPDKGVYNAMNKGIAVANGNYILMLNSGDLLIDNETLERVFAMDRHGDIIYGDVLWDDCGKLFKTMYPKKLSFQYFRNNSLGHQSTFIKKDLHTIVGFYDEILTIVSDWKFFLLSICKYNISHEHISILISRCGRDGISCKPENWNKILAERNFVLNTEFPAFIDDYQTMDVLKEGQVNFKKNVIKKIKKRIRSYLTILVLICSFT